MQKRQTQTILLLVTIIGCLSGLYGGTLSNKQNRIGAYEVIKSIVIPNIEGAIKVGAFITLVRNEISKQVQVDKYKYKRIVIKQGHKVICGEYINEDYDKPVSELGVNLKQPFTVIVYDKDVFIAPVKIIKAGNSFTIKITKQMLQLPLWSLWLSVNMELFKGKPVQDIEMSYGGLNLKIDANHKNILSLEALEITAHTKIHIKQSNKVCKICNNVLSRVSGIFHSNHVCENTQSDIYKKIVKQMVDPNKRDRVIINSRAPNTKQVIAIPVYAYNAQNNTQNTLGHLFNNNWQRLLQPYTVPWYCYGDQDWGEMNTFKGVIKNEWLFNIQSSPISAMYYCTQLQKRDTSPITVNKISVLFEPSLRICEPVAKQKIQDQNIINMTEKIVQNIQPILLSHNIVEQYNYYLAQNSVAESYTPLFRKLSPNTKDDMQIIGLIKTSLINNANLKNNKIGYDGYLIFSKKNQDECLVVVCKNRETQDTDSSSESKVNSSI